MRLAESAAPLAARQTPPTASPAGTRGAAAGPSTAGVAGLRGVNRVEDVAEFRIRGGPFKESPFDIERRCCVGTGADGTFGVGVDGGPSGVGLHAGGEGGLG